MRQVEWWYCLVDIFFAFYRCMTSGDSNDLMSALNDLMPAQEKLEWVTPKISLMDAGDTDGNKPNAFVEGSFTPNRGVS